jgi:hypothetical protein
MRDDDNDIDAMLGSVVGGNGQVIEFPPVKERVAKARPTPLMSEMFGSKPNADRMVELGSALVSALAESDPQAAPVPRAFIDPRTVPVRFSNLKHMARSPLHYLDAVQADREDTLAMRLGRGAHAMVLGEPVVKWDRPAKKGEGKAPRNGKAWDEFVAAHPNTEILSATEWAQAEGMANAIRRHPIAADLLLAADVIREQTIEWEWLGRAWTSRPDARSSDGRIVTDFKTTQCAEPQKFQRDATWRAYNAQLAAYGLAVAYLNSGRAPDDLFVCAVESKRPWPVTVLRLDDGARLQGEKLVRLWMERLLSCEASNHWPAYTDAIVDFSVPSEGDPDAAIDLDELEAEDSEAWA